MQGGPGVLIAQIAYYEMEFQNSSHVDFIVNYAPTLNPPK